MSDETRIPEAAPVPRLCRIRKRADYSGYGFNLQSSETRSGQFIGKVEEGSPARSAGLREGDRIIEVNGVNVISESHQEVVARIRSQEDETTFLVVDEETEEFYRKKNIDVNSSMPQVLRLETPPHTAESIDGGQEFKARICHLKTWPDFSGYGFNLHVDKDSLTHFIGKVDEGSPAHLAGLKEKDILIEVNNTNVQNLSHADVVRIVRQSPCSVVMMVVDEESNNFFKKRNISIASDSTALVERIFCPDVNPSSETTVEISKTEVEHPFKLRLCHIKSWNDGMGFGFNMQSEKNKPGQYIVKVDEGSPAKLGGLREGDFLVEVNGLRIEGLEHKQVVELIKSDRKETKLLVADPEAKNYFDKEQIKMSAELSDSIDFISSPDSKPNETETNSECVDNNNTCNKENLKSDNKNTQAQPREKNELILDVKNIPNSSLYSGQTSPGSPPFSPTIIEGIEFAPTAEEARRRMAKKKQANQQMSLKAKYELFQKM